MTKFLKPEAPVSEPGSSETDAEDTVSALRRLVDETTKHGEVLAEIRTLLDLQAGTAGTIGQDLATFRTSQDEATSSAAPENHLGEVAERIEEQIRIYAADFHRWQEAARGVPGRLRVALAVAAIPALFFLGVLVEQRWEPWPVYDGTGGWKDYVWERYGREIVECTKRAAEGGRDVTCAITASIE